MNYDRDLSWRIRIKKGRRTIREFSGNKLPISCKWDGKNKRGEPVKPGKYKYEISAWIEDEAGEEIVSAKKVSGEVTVFGVKITRDSYEIAAETTWTGISDNLQRSIITISVQPPDTQAQVINYITLEIKEVTGGEGYEPGTGTLAQDPTDKTKWTYTPFTEPKAEKHPKSKNVEIIAKYKGEECSKPITIVVKPVFDRLKNQGGYLSYTKALRYVEWKYDFGTRTGFYMPGLDDYGATTLPGITYYGRAAFHYENILASTIGHEGVHRAQGFWVRLKAFRSKIRYKNKRGNGYNWAVAELPAYKWEWDNLNHTGVVEDFYIDEIKAMIALFEEILSKYDSEGPP